MRDVEGCWLALHVAGPIIEQDVIRVDHSDGVTDMVRISDARMSGTAYGTVVLHTSPEAAVGGPLAVVRDGDMIEIDVDALYDGSQQVRVHATFRYQDGQEQRVRTDVVIYRTPGEGQIPVTQTAQAGASA